MTPDLHRALDRARRAPPAPGLGGRLWAPEVGRTWHRWEPPPEIRSPLQAAVALSTVSTGSQASASSATTASITIGSGEIAFIAVYNYNTGGAAAQTPTITDWTQVGTDIATDGSAPVRVTVLRRVGSFSGTQPISFAGVSQGYILWQIVKATGAKTTGTNGADAVRQAKTANSGSGVRSASVTATFTDFTPTLSGNAILACGLDWDVNALNPRTNFTALYNNADGNIATCLTQGRTTGTDTAVSHSTVSGTGYQAIVGIEIVAATSSVNLSQVSEADTAQAVTRQKRMATGQSGETDTAQAVARSKRKTVGQTSETDTVTALTVRKAVTIGLVAETDTAQGVELGDDGVIDVDVAQVVEADTAQAITRQKRLALAQVTEADTAQAITHRRSAVLGQPSETDTAQAVARRKAKAIGQATETDDARALVFLQPQLGAWAFKAEHLDEPGGGSSIALASITTQTSGGLIVAGVARGEVDNFSNAITDNKGNTFALLDQVRTYTLFPDSGTANYVADPAAGGSGHIVQTVKGIFGGTVPDEVTLWAVEVKNGTHVADVAWNEPLAGSPLTSGTVTVDGPAVLIAVWWGDANTADSTLSVGDGFTLLATELRSSESIIQCGLAVKEVSEAGTYDVTWTETPDQGAQLWLIAVQAGGEIVEAVEQVVETDTAQAVTARKRKTLTQPADADTALSLAARKARTVGQASEADGSMAVSSRKARAVGMASEADSARSLTIGRRFAVAIAAETDTAGSVSGVKRKTLGLVVEADVALALGPEATPPALTPPIYMTVEQVGGIYADVEQIGYYATVEEDA